MALRDLNDAWGWIQRLIRRVSRLESGALLENSSITDGRMRFIGGTLRVDAGGRVEIVGTLEVDGASTVTGVFNVEGPWTLSGDGTITGAVTVSGPVTISGNVGLTGTMNVTGDIVVAGSGEIRAGGMTIDPAANGGSVVFSGGKAIHAASDALGMYFGSVSVVLNTAANLIGPGSSFVAGATPRIGGLPSISSGAAGGLPSGAIWADGSGNLYRVT